MIVADRERTAEARQKDIDFVMDITGLRKIMIEKENEQYKSTIANVEKRKEALALQLRKRKKG